MLLTRHSSASRFALGLLLSLVLLNSAHAKDGEWLTELDLKQYPNKVVYIDFWASWCGPCRDSFPWINAMQEKYKDKGLVVIGVNLDAEPEAARLFLKQNPANFKLFSDPTGTLAEKYELIGMPSSFVIDGTGKLRHRHVGFKKNKTDQYEKSIVSLLNELPNQNISLAQE